MGDDWTTESCKLRARAEILLPSADVSVDDQSQRHSFSDGSLLLETRRVITHSAIVDIQAPHPCSLDHHSVYRDMGAHRHHQHSGLAGEPRIEESRLDLRRRLQHHSRIRTLCATNILGLASQAPACCEAHNRGRFRISHSVSTSFEPVSKHLNLLILKSQCKYLNHLPCPRRRQNALRRSKRPNNGRTGLHLGLRRAHTLQYRGNVLLPHGRHNTVYASLPQSLHQRLAPRHRRSSRSKRKVTSSQRIPHQQSDEQILNNEEQCQ